jgi:hypothetical protein
MTSLVGNLKPNPPEGIGAAGFDCCQGLQESESRRWFAFGAAVDFKTPTRSDISSLRTPEFRLVDA